MNEHQSQTAITTSALVVGGFYLYRSAVGSSKGEKPTGKQTAKSAAEGLVGVSKSPIPVGTFVAGWGITYVAISIMGSVSPDVGGSFAILVAVGAALGNLMPILKALQSGVFKPLNTGVKKSG